MARDAFGFDLSADDEGDVEHEDERDEDEQLDGVGTYYACLEEPDPRPRCSVPGCFTLAPRACKYELRGRLAGTACGRRLCKVHGRDSICPAHARLTEAA